VQFFQIFRFDRGVLRRFNRAIYMARKSGRHSLKGRRFAYGGIRDLFTSANTVSLREYERRREEESFGKNALRNFSNPSASRNRTYPYYKRNKNLRDEGENGA